MDNLPFETFSFCPVDLTIASLAEMRFGCFDVMAIPQQTFCILIATLGQ